MSISAGAGPNVKYGQNPPIASGATAQDFNSDRAPSLNDQGSGLLDPQFGYKIGGGGQSSSGPNSSPLAYGFCPGVNYAVVDQVPSLAAVAVIAAGANPASGTPMALVSSTGGGVTVMTAPLFITPTGLTVPACLALDGLPGWVSFGQSGAIQGWDPTKILARAVSVTGVGSGSGGAVTVAGFDYRGNPQTETITLGAGANTVNGKKAFKFVQSVTPGFSDTHNISIGTSDVYGLPLRADVYGYVNATFNNAPVTSPTFVKADLTTATATTGDVRGTIVSTSDGTKRLQIMQGVSPANLNSLTSISYAGLFGVVPA